MGNIGSSPIYKAATEGDVLAVRLAVQQHPTQIDTVEDTVRQALNLKFMWAVRQDLFRLLKTAKFVIWA